MIRNLKVLGLALVAVFAMSAIVASAASAQNGLLTSDGPFILTGTDTVGGENSLTYPGLETVKCPESHYNAGALEKTSVPGTHEAIASGANSITVSPTYTNCRAGSAFVTVDMNGCDYVFTLGATTGTGDTYGVTAKVVCPKNVKIKLTVFADSGHNFSICTAEFGEQTPVSKAHATDTTNGLIRIHGTFEGIKANNSGLCGTGSTEAAIYHVDVEVSGENSSKSATNVTISHT